MALYENKITLKGYLGKDAENIATKQQRTFTVLSLATKSGYKDKQTNEWVNHTEWHRIVAFGKPADYAKNLKKGDYVEIEGELRSDRVRRRSRRGQEEDHGQAPWLGSPRQHRSQAGAARELAWREPRRRADHGGRRRVSGVVLPREVQS